jgi:hypothetical protein
MHHRTGKLDLQRELHQLVDTVAPRVESAVNTVTEKAPPLIDRGRTAASDAAHRGKVVAVEKGTLLAGRIPDDVVDRLPAPVADRLPVKRSGRGKKLLVLALVGGAVAAAAAAVRRSQQSGSAAHRSTPAPPPRPTDAGPVSTGPSTTTPEASDQLDPSDPLVEPRVNGRIN